MTIFSAVCIAVLCISWFGFLGALDDGLALLYKEGFVLIVALIAFAFFIFRRQLLTHPEKLFLVIVLSLTCGSSWVYDTNEVSWDIESHYAFMLDFANFGAEYNFTEADEGIVLRELEAPADDENIELLNEYETEQDQPSSRYKNAKHEATPLRQDDLRMRSIDAHLRVLGGKLQLRLLGHLLDDVCRGEHRGRGAVEWSPG